MNANQTPKSAMICKAIEGRRLLEFDYGDKRRVVAPYCYGISTKGSEVLRAIQLRGAGAAAFGKLWLVEKITRLRVLDVTFVPDDPNYNPNDKGMKEIRCRV